MTISELRVGQIIVFDRVPAGSMLKTSTHYRVDCLGQGAVDLVRPGTFNRTLIPYELLSTGSFRVCYGG